MTHYTIVPEELYWSSPEVQESIGELEINGVLMQVRMEPGNRATIMRLLNCKLSDYLNPAFAPGKQIMYFPVLMNTKDTPLV